MEVLESAYSILSVIGVSAIVAALAVARVITPLERRLVTSTALLLAGVFFVVQHGVEPAAQGIGAAAWVVGLGAFVRDALVWHSRDASRAGPLAVFFLLPPAFFGALLLTGLVVSLIVV